MAARRRKILLRRVAAVLLAAGGTALAWLLLFGGEHRDDGPGSAPAGVSKGSLRAARSLTVAQQVDQVLLLGFDGTTARGSSLAPELASRQLGGALVARRNWRDATQGAALIDALGAVAARGGSIAPIIATAQEGGPHRALADLPAEATALSIGDTADPAAARNAARESGAALRGVGIGLDLVPVADVATLDSPLADRTFSDDPELTASFTAAWLGGCEQARIACAPGHFPGLGAATQDTDDGPATVGLDEASLATRDLLPFQAAIAARVPAITLSLAFYPAYDAVTPAALVPEIATGLLRERMRFRGVAITDDLGAGAVKATMSVPKAAVAALAAGADLLRIDFPADQRGVREALLRAVADGAIPKQRLAAAAARVLELKRRFGPG